MDDRIGRRDASVDSVMFFKGIEICLDNGRGNEGADRIMDDDMGGFGVASEQPLVGGVLSGISTRDDTDAGVGDFSCNLFLVVWVADQENLFECDKGKEGRQSVEIDFLP